MKPHNSERLTGLKRKRDEAEEEARERSIRATSKNVDRAAKRARTLPSQRERPSEEVPKSSKETLSKRQTGLKRKRDEAEEEAHERSTGATSKNVNGAAKRARTLPSQKERPSEEVQKSSEGTLSKTASRALKRKGTNSSRPVTRSESRKLNKANGQQSGNPWQSEHLNQPSVRLDQSPNIAAKAITTARVEEFLAVLVSNAASERVLRHQHQQADKWIQYRERILDHKGGIQDLDARIALAEAQGENVLELRQAREDKRRLMRFAELCLEHINVNLRDLADIQTRRNSRIYDFADLPRGAAHLQSLSNTFWESFDKCQTANTATRDLELELLELEQVQEENIQRLDEYGRRVVRTACDAAAGMTMLPPGSGNRDSAEVLQSCLDALIRESKGREDKRALLTQARSAQAKVEAELNGIAHDTLVKFKLLHADPLDTSECQNDQGSRNEAVDNGHHVADGRMARNESSASSASASGEGSEPETNSNNEPQESIGGQGSEQDRIRREAEAESKRCKLHHGKRRRTQAAIDAMKFRVAKARRRLAFCQDDLEMSREVIPPAAQYMDRDRQGAARLEAMNEATRRLVAAEKECRDALREAQNEGAITNEKDQQWNFCCCDDEQFTNGHSGFPLPLRMQSDVWNWLDQPGNGLRASTPELLWEPDVQWQHMLDAGLGGNAPKPESPADEQTNCDKLLEPGYGEDRFSNFEYDVERRQHIDRQRVVQEDLRREGGFENAENDFHPMNRKAGLSPDLFQPWCWGNVDTTALIQSVEQSHGEKDELHMSTASEDPLTSRSTEQNVDGSSPGGLAGGEPHNDPHLNIDNAIDGYDGDNMDGIE